MEHSKRRVQKLRPSKIYFGHYGVSEKLDEIYCQFEYWLQRFITIGNDVWREEQDVKRTNDIVAKKYMKKLKKNLMKKVCHWNILFLQN